jgi:ParB-like chromosome segregation protein Spo0J
MLKMESPSKFELVAREAEKLIRDRNNARTHSEAQVAQIAASIKEFGFTNPVLLDEHDRVIAGEGRVLAAMKLKMTAVPCFILAGLTTAQKRAYAIADNKIALNSAWNLEVLAHELSALQTSGMDVHLTGFSEVELMDLVGQAESAIAQLVLTVDHEPPEPEQGEQPEEPQERQPQQQQPESEVAPEVRAQPTTPPDWSGMPDFSETTDKPFRTIVVHFADQAAVDAFARATNQSITDKTKYLWYPVHIKRTAKGIVYA